MISSSDHSSRLIQQLSSKQEQAKQEEAEEKNRVETDRTPHQFRSTSDSNFGDRKPNRQDPVRPPSFSSSSSFASSSSPAMQDPEFKSDSKGFKGKATMTTGHEVWDQPGTGPVSLGHLSDTTDHVFRNNVMQSDISAQIKIATMQSMLDKKLGPELITKRNGAGGSKLSYIEGWKAIDLANKVFGFNGWSTEIVRLVTDFCEQDQNRKWKAGATCIARVTLRDGTFHEDIGYGLSVGMSDQGATLQKVLKEAVTDATKRCLRQFGNLLGNCLYDKNFLQQVSKMKPEPYPPADLSSIVRHGSPTKSPPRDSKSMPPPQAPRPQPPQQQQSSSSSSNQALRNNMNRSEAGPANPQQTSKSNQGHAAGNAKPNVSTSKPPASILKPSAPSTNNSRPDRNVSTLGNLQHEDEVMDETFGLDEGSQEFSEEFFEGIEEAIDSELIEIHSKSATESGNSRSASSGEKKVVEGDGDGDGEQSKRGSGSGGAWSNADDSGIVINPDVTSEAVSKPNSDQDVKVQSSNPLTPKLELLEQDQATAQSKPLPPPQMPQQPQQPKPQQNKTPNASKGRFAKPGAGTGSIQSGAMSLSKIQTSHPSSNATSGKALTGASGGNNLTATGPTLNRRSHTTSSASEGGNLHAAGSGFSTASSVAHEGGVGMEQRARSSVSGRGGGTGVNSVQGRNSSHAHVSKTDAASRKRGPEGLNDATRNPLDALPIDAQGSVKKRKE